MNPSVVTRFPPSPTGLLQAGNARTAVFNYLFAKKHDGKFILRIEDTDRERSKVEFEQGILDTVAWLGFPHDAFYRQSEQAGRHQEVLAQLIQTGAAYISKETPIEAGQRDEVIRFKNPNTAVTFTDIIRGDITVDTTDLGDFIIARSLQEPLYHLGVVVDDFDEGVTHVIRGEDHISNTPRQILILRAIGATIPLYAHLPLVFGQDGKKLSKRTGAKAITEYRDEGFLPEAVVNYLALLGWHPEDEKELFTVDELTEVFTLERIQKSSGIFDEVKLRWFNHEHLKLLSKENYISRLIEYLERGGEPVPSYLPSIYGELKNRVQTFGEAADCLKNGEFSFMAPAIPTPAKELILQGAKADSDAVKTYLLKVVEMLRLHEDFTTDSIKKLLFPYATEVGRASVLWPMRVALSGKEKSPDPFTVASLLGREETIKRLEKALDSL